MKKIIKQNKILLTITVVLPIIFIGSLTGDIVYSADDCPCICGAPVGGWACYDCNGDQCGTDFEFLVFIIPFGTSMFLIIFILHRKNRLLN